MIKILYNYIIINVISSDDFKNEKDGSRHG